MQGNLFGNLNMVCLIFVTVALVGLWDGPNVVEAKALPGQEVGEMRSAIKFLQDLDNFYAAQTRPRSDRVRREDDVANTLMKLSQIKQHYSNVGRPRFGKRANIPGEALDEDYPSQFENLQNIYHWKSR